MAKPLRTVVITGASSGIGAALARELAPICQELVLVARRQELLANLAHELKVGHQIDVQVLALDIAGFNSARTFWEQVSSTIKGPIDLWINNAGFGLYGDIVETSLEREQEMVDLNVTTLMVLSKLVAADMVQRGRGHILNVASVAAFQPGPGMAVYFASKAFVLSFTEALDCELRNRGVRATALCPGSTATDFHTIANTERVKWMHRLMRSTAQDVAQAAVRGVLSGETVVVPGLLNRLMVVATRALPRSWVVRLSRMVLKT